MNNKRDIPTPNYVPEVEPPKRQPKGLEVKVSVQDLDLFKDIISMLKSILDNTDIDKVIRDYYRDMLENILIK